MTEQIEQLHHRDPVDAAVDVAEAEGMDAVEAVAMDVEMVDMAPPNERLNNLSKL